MDHGIDALEIAPGLKDALINSRLTIESILNSGPVEIASVLGIDVYVAKIIFDATLRLLLYNDDKLLELYNGGRCSNKSSNSSIRQLYQFDKE
jgi:hypothetical protein